MSITYNKIHRKLTRSYILNIVNRYGFSECGDLSAFLNFVCRDKFLHLNEYRYINKNTTMHQIKCTKY